MTVQPPMPDAGGPLTAEDYVRAAGRLRAGQPVAFPTETVYGLGGNAFSDAAVAAIYAMKGRPSHNPLIIHAPFLEMIERDILFPPEARILAEAYWPGPLTLVVRRGADCRLSPLVSAGGETVAVRIPAHPVAQALLREAELPLAAPSANRSGAVSPTCAAHVRESLGGNVMVLDGGDCPVGIESTVLDVSALPFRILRHGSVTQEELQTLLPEGRLALDTAEAAGALKSPGLLSSHYAPKAALRLNADAPEADETFLAFGPTGHAGLNLSPAGDLREAARHLFAHLRRLDAEGAERIAVMPIPDSGIGRALNDRLKRAAAPRDVSPLR